MKYKKFSDLDSVENIADNDLFAISSAKNNGASFESGKVTFGQMKEQLDYDFDIVEVKEVTPPPEDDETVYILINGYRVAATRAKEDVPAVYPTKISRIIPAVSGFMAAKGNLYTIPFTTSNLTLSNLSITSDANNFSTLEVFKIDDNSGYINLVSTVDKEGNYSSIVTVKDEVSGINTSILVYHSRLIISLANSSITVSDNIIKAKWKRDDITSGSRNNYGVIKPKFSLSEDIKYKVYYASDYFNQASVYKVDQSHVQFEATFVLLEPFSGDLIISFEDLNQGAGGMVMVNVDYTG